MPSRVFTTSDTFTVPVYTKLIIEVWGGGGGGGATNASSTRGGTGGTGGDATVTGTRIVSGTPTAFTITARGGTGGQGGAAYLNNYSFTYFYFFPSFGAAAVAVNNEATAISGTGGIGGSVGSGGTFSNVAGNNGGAGTNTAPNAGWGAGGNGPAGWSTASGGGGSSIAASGTNPAGGGGAGNSYYIVSSGTSQYNVTFNQYFGPYTTTATGSGGGGGSGGFSRSDFATGDLTVGSNLTVTIGAAGAAGAGGGPGGAGATGYVIISWSYIPPAIPAGPILMTDIATSYQALDGSPSGPYLITDFQSNFLQDVPADQTPTANQRHSFVRNIATGLFSNFNTSNQPRTPSPGPYIPWVRAGTINPTNTDFNAAQIAFNVFGGLQQPLQVRYPILLNGSSAASQNPFNLWANKDVIYFRNTGAVQTFNFYNARIIKIECWGGDSVCQTPAGSSFTLGGYSVGVYLVSPYAAGGLNGPSLQIYVGGASSLVTGGFSAIATGGYNGGGNGFTYPVSNQYYRAGGGGASDVRTTASLNDRIIVAGGAGGGMYIAALGLYIGGGPGGGTSGSDGLRSSYFPTYPSSPGLGGTASAGGAAGSSNGGVGTAGTFGQGGSYTTQNAGACGGGGGWYGGGGQGTSGSYLYSATAGGGSGYIDYTRMLQAVSNSPTAGYPGASEFGVTSGTFVGGGAGYVSKPDTINGESVGRNGLVKITIIG